MKFNVAPASVAEAIEAFDYGVQIGSIEMDGTGPVAELQVQLLMIDILRYLPLLPTKETVLKVADERQAVVCNADQLGEMSDEQKTSATNLAFSFAHDGWNKTLTSVAPDRRIMISNFFPSVV